MKKLESQIQSNFIKLARMYLANTGVLVHSIPNESYGGTKGDMIRGAKLKREGRLKGVPDVFIALARLGYHGLYIEFKKPKGTLRSEQREVISKLREKGYCVAVCRYEEDALNLLRRYSIGSEKDEVLQEHHLK